MFGKLKDKLKSALSIFSKKAEEEAEVKVVEAPVEIKPQEVISGIKPKEVVPEIKPKAVAPEVKAKEVPKKEEKKVEKKKEEPKKVTEKKEILPEKKEPILEKELVLIIHGWEDNAESGFIPALKESLYKNNIKALSFDQPHTEKPQFEEWLSFAERKIAEHKAASLSIVGHSMGGLLALKLAERYKLKKLILVAPVGSNPSEEYFKLMGRRLSAEDLSVFRKYQSRNLDIPKIKNNSEEIAFLFGLKDEWITDEIRNYYLNSFKEVAEIHLFEEYGHMSQSEGVKELPILKELLSKKIKAGISEHKKTITKKIFPSEVKITYFVHGNTTDNEKEIATGWNQGELSAKGVQQSKELWEKIKDKHFDIVFSSDLKRAVHSAELTFGKRTPIIQDQRLRECNYGEFNGKDAGSFKSRLAEYVIKPFPSGESYHQVEKRIAEFLNYLYENYKGKHIAIVAHQAPQLAMDVLLQGRTWEQAIKDDWRLRKAWQPGWEYWIKNKVEITEIPELKKSFFGKLFGKKEEKPAEIVTEKVVEAEKIEKPPAEEQKTFLEKLRQAVTTKTISTDKFNELFWDLEIVLLENNVSVEVIERIKKDLEKELVDKPLPRDVEGKIMETLKKTLLEILTFPEVDLIQKTSQKKPFIIAFFGINGTGKTTSIAKLTHYFQQQKKSVVLAACDTFRAAAIQQLEEHADKLGVKMIKQDYGSDAAAVAFDAVKYAEKNKIDIVMIDTAGRLHSNTNLMAELEKIIRIAKPDFKIFVGESITGNDCIEQARQFNQLVEMDGAILTKADVDEKGGAPLSIAYTIKKPILFLGVGQRYQDLEKFEARQIVQRLGL